MRFAVLLLPLFVAACALPGGFPSLQPRAAETPRQIEAPDAGQPAPLAEAERQRLAADLARERAVLGRVSAAIDAAAAELDRRLARPGATTRGAAAWSDAEMQLSRLDVARLPLDDLRARLAPLRLLVDSLAADDEDRLAVEALVADADRAAIAAAARAAAAGRALDGPGGRD